LSGFHQQLPKKKRKKSRRNSCGKPWLLQVIERHAKKKKGFPKERTSIFERILVSLDFLICRVPAVHTCVIITRGLIQAGEHHQHRQVETTFKRKHRQQKKGKFFLRDMHI
jgi:hypothetical protein